MQQQMAPHVLEDEDEHVEPSKKRPCLRDESEEDVAASQEVCRSRHGPTTLSSKSNHVRCPVPSITSQTRIRVARGIFGI